MPLKAKKPCAKSGCRNLSTEFYCEEHRAEVKKQAEWERGTAAKRGYGHKWRLARAGYLRKHPICVHCHNNDRLNAATVVDHIIPHRGDKELFWKRDNWQPLCASCHSIKTATEDGGFGN
ncbi:HNH endonuclease [Paenibacillus sp. RC84]|uniref:HNH endonuclease n=1 Tax=Paenibacillus sp. RC84 TaxID=3156252 RepID=UPI0035144513